MTPVAACTILARNYLAQARVLARSFREHNAGIPTFALVLDPIDGSFDSAVEPFETVTLAEIGIPDEKSICFRHPVAGLARVVMPFFLDHVLKKGFERLLYLDPDILVFSTLKPLFERLADRPILLTPHVLRPESARHENLKRGAFNPGFLGVSRAPQAFALLDWLKQRSAENDPMEDPQRWIDLAPAFFPEAEVVTDAGCNVAYWNLHERRIGPESIPTVDGQPLRFFHFSGYDPTAPTTVSRHGGPSIDSVGPAARVFDHYADLLLQAGYEKSIHWPYGYGRFDNGVHISPLIRDIYAQRSTERTRHGDPFHTTEPHSFFNWLCAKENGGMSNIARSVWQRRRTEQAMPAFGEKEQDAFLDWFRSIGGRVFHLDPILTGRGASVASLPWALGSRLTHALRATSCRVCVARDVLHMMRIRPHVPEIVAGTPVSADGVPANATYRRLPAATARLLRALLNPCGIHKGVLRLLENGADARPRAREPRTTPTLGVNLVGYFQTQTGLSHAARHMQRAMQAAGIPTRAIACEADSGHGMAAERSGHNGQAMHPLNVLQVNADAMPDVASRLSGSFFAGRYSIGAWMWELPEFPREWMDRFRYVDEVWAASLFACDAIARVSPLPVVRIPVPIGEPRPASLPRSHFGVPDRSCLFLFVFDYGSIFERKNPLALVQAFRSAFRHSENVTLVIKTSRSSIDPQNQARLREAVHDLPIRLIEGVMTRQELDALFAHADCYVSLHRSEGYGLTMAEAMRAGKPVIATGWSGNVDFMTPANSYLVRSRIVALEKDHPPYRRGTHWADPDVAHAADLMRYVYEHRDEAMRLGQVARADIEHQLSFEAVGKQIRQRLQMISDRLLR